METTLLTILAAGVVILFSCESDNIPQGMMSLDL